MRMTWGVDDWGSSTDEGWEREVQDWGVVVAHLHLEDVYQQNRDTADVDWGCFSLLR